MPPPDHDTLTAAAAHRLAADLAQSGAGPAASCSRASCAGWTVTIVVSPTDPVGEKLAPVREPVVTPCQRDILSVLSSERRLTTDEVLAELEKRGLIHGVRTVKGALSQLVHDGRINSSRRAPRGYYLPSQLQLFPVPDSAS